MKDFEYKLRHDQSTESLDKLLGAEICSAVVRGLDIATPEKAGLFFPALNQIGPEEFLVIQAAVSRGEKARIQVTKSDYSRKRLGSSQATVEPTKLCRASQVYEREETFGTLLLRRNSHGLLITELVFTDGHHRAALALLDGIPTTVIVDKTWNILENQPNPNNTPCVLGFNIIVKQVQSLLNEK